MNDLQSLIIKAQKGDLDAFGRLVRRFQNMVYGYAYGILGDFHLAEDVAQEAFLEVYRRLAELRNVEAFTAWLRSIVFKYCDRLTRRKEIEMVHFDLVPHLASEELEPDDLIVKKEVRNQVVEVVQNLPEKERVVTSLFYMNEFSQMASEELEPDDLIVKKEVRNQVVEVVQNLPEKERVVTSLFYMNEFSQKEVATFLEVPVSTVKNRLHTARQLIKERVIDMGDEGLLAFRLPDRFADVIVHMQFVLGQINPLERRMQALADDQLSVKGAELQRRLREGESRDEIKAEAFALVKEASRRVLGMAHYDVQLVAGVMMDNGWVAEVASGEGKSLTCLLPAYMAVLEDKRVHVVTLNDGLAQRDAEMAAEVFFLLGVAVGVIEQESNHKTDYLRDITYGAYTAFAFDGLRDTIRKSGDSAVQNGHDFAIIDEVDRVLIHEGRTRVVMAQKEVLDVGFYETADRLARKLISEQNESHMLFERSAKSPYSISITSSGMKVIHSNVMKVESDLIHQIEQALRAHRLYQRNRDYVVKDGQVIILDGETGKLTPGRRFSDGLHQALEVKEGVDVWPEIEAQGRLLVQDYFRNYSKLAGVTGTGKIYEDEFHTRYGLTVGVVPTREALNRIDYEDRVYQDASARDEAVVDEVRQYNQETGRPVLVGVSSIEDAVRLSKLFQSRGIECDVIHSLMGENVSQKIGRVGQVGRVTIATEVIGRGADICVGEDALRLGGLHIIGYGRHKLRVQDDQLIARAGRQGQAGSSRFFLSRDDEIVMKAWGDTWGDIGVEHKKVLEDRGFVESKGVTDVVAGVQAEEAKRQFELRQKLDEAEM